MQIISIELFMLVALLIVSLIDLKYKAIPSVLMTSLLFMVAITNISNIGGAVLLVILGLLIKDMDLENHILGIADFKAFAIVGFLLHDILSVIIFIWIFLIFQVVWAVISRKIVKMKDVEIPYLIVFFLSYLTFFIIQRTIL